MAKQSRVINIGDADLKLLRIFKSVVQSGGLSAAENELNVGRSTISKNLADLEFRLDLKLCNRGPSGFSLTEDGEKVLRAADRLLDSVLDFRAEVNEIKRNLVGTIRVSLFDQCASNPESQLARAINKFNQLAPKVDIELSIEPPNVIEAMVIGGRLDVGIVAEHRVAPSLNYSPLYGENMCLYCGKDHQFFDQKPGTIDIEDVRKTNYAGISVTSPNMHIGQTLKLRRTANVQSEHALSILILSGRYVGFLPDHLAHDHVRGGLMKAILPEKLNYRAKFSAITRRTPEPDRITTLFLKMLENEHAC